jgi:hypothetical protein
VVSRGLENVPPLEDFHVTAQIPSSPKRRKSTSHYSDVDCSPSKKRDHAASRPKLSKEERALLFGDTTNNRVKGMGSDVLTELPQPNRKNSKVMKGQRVEVVLAKPTICRKEVVDIFN